MNQYATAKAWLPRLRRLSPGEEPGAFDLLDLRRMQRGEPNSKARTRCVSTPAERRGDAHRYVQQIARLITTLRGSTPWKDVYSRLTVQLDAFFDAMNTSIGVGGRPRIDAWSRAAARLLEAVAANGDAVPAIRGIDDVGSPAVRDLEIEIEMIWLRLAGLFEDRPSAEEVRKRGKDCVICGKPYKPRRVDQRRCGECIAAKRRKPR